MTRLTKQSASHWFRRTQPETEASIQDGSTDVTSSSDPEQAHTEFLKHYEAFAETTIENPIVWQSQAFHKKLSRQDVLHIRWVQLGVLSAAVGGAVLVLRHATPQPSVSQERSPNPAELKTPPIPETPAAPISPAENNIPDNPAQVPRIISPPIRSPQPENVLIPSIETLPIAPKPASKLPKPQHSLPATSQPALVPNHSQTARDLVPQLTPLERLLSTPMPPEEKLELQVMPAMPVSGFSAPMPEQTDEIERSIKPQPKS